MIQDYSSLPMVFQIALQELTMVEEMLISPVMPLMTILRLHSGQNIQRGYACSFRQNNLSIITSIPRLVSQLPLLIVKKGNAKGELKELQVNRKRLKTVIEHLILLIPTFRFTIFQ